MIALESRGLRFLRLLFATRITDIGRVYRRLFREWIYWRLFHLNLSRANFRFLSLFVLPFLSFWLGIDALVGGRCLSPFCFPFWGRKHVGELRQSLILLR